MAPCLDLTASATKATDAATSKGTRQKLQIPIIYRAIIEENAAFTATYHRASPRFAS